jgi:Sulfotransferase domain
MTAEPMKRALQASFVPLIGRPTSRWRTLPNVLIAGGQRCGTTSMYRALIQHPAVLRAVGRKGVHYFDTDYDRGPNWYRGHFPLTRSVERVRRATESTPVVLESSPYYGFHPLAATRIDADLPGVKLIVLIRDPVERAYSAHAHEFARGFESETFERALALEPERLKGQDERLVDQPFSVSLDHQHHAYVARGQYVELLRRLAGVVGRDRLHVVDSHRFFAEPEDVWADTLAFLDLPAGGDPVFERHNARPRSPMSAEVRHQLEEHFRPWDDELIEWLGWVPSWRS